MCLTLTFLFKEIFMSTTKFKQRHHGNWNLSLQFLNQTFGPHSTSEPVLDWAWYGGEEKYREGERIRGYIPKIILFLAPSLQVIPGNAATDLIMPLPKIAGISFYPIPILILFLVS